jgi:uncharacterized Ntn-hydrolase superfamily protein
MSRRPDGVTVDINVCEHAEPIVEMRRIYDAISEKLGFRTLRQFSGGDVLQLKVMLHALGYLGPAGGELALDAPAADVYDHEAVEAVNRFRSDQAWQTTVSGLVDARTIERIWSRLEAAGQADAVRERLLEIQRVTR